MNDYNFDNTLQFTIKICKDFTKDYSERLIAESYDIYGENIKMVQEEARSYLSNNYIDAPYAIYDSENSLSSMGRGGKVYSIDRIKNHIYFDLNRKFISEDWFDNLPCDEESVNYLIKVRSQLQNEIDELDKNRKSSVSQLHSLRDIYNVMNGIKSNEDSDIYSKLLYIIWIYRIDNKIFEIQNMLLEEK